MAAVSRQEASRSFGASLARLREEAGFSSAYQFYHKNGGRRHFPFTYVHYLRIERKGMLPRPDWLALILTALRLSPGQAGWREFCLAYLRGLLGSENVAAAVLDPLLCRHGEAGAKSQNEGLRWAKSAHAAHLSPRQFAAIASDEAAYWCSEILLNDRGSWSAEDISAALGFPVPDVRSGLKALKSAGLARESSRGKFRARQAGKFYTFPGRLRDMQGDLKRVQAYWERMRRRKGGAACERVELVRAAAGSMQRYIAGLWETLDTANLHATQSAGEDSGLYLIEARVGRLMPF